jgi:hypothetical protein
MINQTTKQNTKNASRLEQERSFRTTVVNIDAISPDGNRALVRTQMGYNKQGDAFQVRILKTPGISIPTDVTNYIGLMHGDPKNPIGVQLIPKAVVEPNIDHAVPNATYGSNSGKPPTPVEGQMPVQDVTIEQKIFNRRHPMDHTMVLKPPMPISQQYIGANRLTIDNPAQLVDEKGAYIAISENEVRLIGNEANGIIINPESGISFYGKMNIGTSIQDFRMGGAWRMNPMLQFQIPSTAITPQPTLIWDPPGLDITKGMGDIMGLIQNTPIA